MSAQRVSAAELRHPSIPEEVPGPREAVSVEVRPDGSIVCGWFALCDNTAAGVVFHAPSGDYFPTCSRCADRLGLEVIPATFEVDTA